MIFNLIHATSRVLNTFTLIFTHFWCSTTIMLAWTLPLNQIIAIIAFDSYLHSLTLFRMAFLGAAHGWGAKVGAKRSLVSKICHTYPTLMKLGTVISYLRKMQKKSINHVTHPLSSADIRIFSLKISNFLVYQEIQV